MAFLFTAFHNAYFSSFSDIFSVAVEEILMFLAADLTPKGEEESNTGPLSEIPIGASASA